VENAMLMTPPAAPIEKPGSRIDQLQVTHCLYDEGVFRQAGFTIRAASTRDPLLLRFAQEYPFYRSPLGMKEGQASASAAPRRLALVRIPGGRSALVHSVPLMDDGRGRPNNFVSHILVHSSLHPREALAAWASTGWMMGYHPPATDKDVAPLQRVPNGEVVCDAAVTALLQAAVDSDDADLATLIFPPRLAGLPERRRELLSLALRGCLLALQAGPTAARGRFYLLAEPGFTALLLYAVARLLPQALAKNLTFSTYEHAHRDLRSYKHTQVVGTYLADPSQGLEEEYYTTRGFALDTFSNKYSPELMENGELPIDEWIDLATRGEWGTIDKVHRLQGKTATSLVSFKDALHAAKLSRLMASGKANAEDLIALKRSSCGPSILERHRDMIWPLVRDGSLTDASLREEFGELLRDNLTELEQRAATVMRGQSPATWQPHWKLISAILGGQPARLRDTFQRIVPEPPYAAELRFPLLRELRCLQLSPIDQRLPLNALLRDCSTDELDQFALSDLPREWFVLALCHALARTATRAYAVRRLHEGDDALIRSFWEQFKLLVDETQRRVILARLFRPDDPQSEVFLGRLLNSGCSVRAETLEWLLNSLDAFSRKKDEFWDRDNHLGQLLEMLRGLGDEAESIWARLCSQINQDVLLRVDAHQNTLLLELASAKDRPGRSIPVKIAEIISEWVVLREHFEKATGIAADASPAIIAACNHRDLDLIAILKRYFERFIEPQGLIREVLVDFVGFFHSFYPDGTEYQDHGSRLLAWLDVVGGCTDEARRAEYQQFYLDTFVPPEYRRRLTEETSQAGKLLPAVLEHVPLAIGTAAATCAIPIGAAADEVFQLTGVRIASGQPCVSFVSMWNRLPWLLCTICGGLLVALVTGFFHLKPTALAVLAPFVPLVAALAESMTLQSVALSTVRLQGQRPNVRDLFHTLGVEVLAAAILGVVSALVVGGVTMAWKGNSMLSLALGISVAGGVLSAAVFGIAVPFALGRVRWASRIAGGPIARCLVSTLALAMFFSLARWLIG